MRIGLGYLAARGLTLLVVGYLFSLAHQRVMQGATLIWQEIVTAAVGR
jgi:hypothetical protein